MPAVVLAVVLVSVLEAESAAVPTVLFAVRDEVGALYRMLQPFYENGVNLTKIESRPLKEKAWEYVFFVDCEGHVAEEPVQRALDQLEKQCKLLKVLGSYPVAETAG